MLLTIPNDTMASLLQRHFSRTLVAVALVGLPAGARAEECGEPVQKSQEESEESWETSKGCRKLWEQSKDIWFEGQEHLTVAEKRRLFENFAADRKLTTRQKDCILTMWDRLLDKKHPCRCDIPGWLGDMGHAYCIPPLLAVLREKSEQNELRVQCVYALSRIADKRAVDALVDALADQDAEVAEDALRYLPMMVESLPPELSEAHPPLSQDAAARWRKELQAKYRAWWEKNRDRVKLSRANVVGDAPVSADAADDRPDPAQQRAEDHRRHK